MPHHKSCKKRMRTSLEANVRNRAYKSNLRSLVRQVKEATDPAEAQEKLGKVTSMLDRLARKGLVHKNYAANHKSKLTRGVSKITG